MNEQVNQIEPGVEGGFFKQVIGVFSAPRAAFTSILQSRQTLVIIIILALISAAVAYIQVPYNVEQQADLMKLSDKIPAEVIAQSSQITVANYIQAVVSAILLTVLGVLLVVSALSLFGGNILFGGQSNFKTIWSVTAYSWLIVVFGAIIQTILIVLKGSMNVSIGFGALIPNGGPTSISWLLLSIFDFFKIWHIIVLGIGFSVLYKVSTGKGIAIACVGVVPIYLFFLGLGILAMTLGGIPLSW